MNKMYDVIFVNESTLIDHVKAVALTTQGYLEKLLFRPISVSQRKEKCSHVINMLRFLFSQFLDLGRKI